MPSSRSLQRVCVLAVAILCAKVARIERTTLPHCWRGKLPGLG